jgi:hypothetical protein
MGFLFTRDGSISLVRVSLLISFIGGVFLVGSLIAFQLDQQTRRAPLAIELPPGAESWGARDLGAAWRETTYKVPGGNLDEIARFYDRKMLEHYGGDTGDPAREKCIRFPNVGQFTNDANDANNVFQPDFVPGEHLPVYWECFFERSTDMTQWTKVRLYNGLPNVDPLLNSQGSVVIYYEQRWESQ